MHLNNLVTEVGVDGRLFGEQVPNKRRDCWGAPVQRRSMDTRRFSTSTNGINLSAIVLDGGQVTGEVRRRGGPSDSTSARPDTTGGPVVS